MAAELTAWAHEISALAASGFLPVQGTQIGRGARSASGSPRQPRRKWRRAIGSSRPASQQLDQLDSRREARLAHGDFVIREGTSDQRTRLPLDPDSEPGWSGTDFQRGIVWERPLELVRELIPIFLFVNAACWRGGGGCWWRRKGEGQSAGIPRTPGASPVRRPVRISRSVWSASSLLALSGWPGGTRAGASSATAGGGLALLSVATAVSGKKFIAPPGVLLCLVPILPQQPQQKQAFSVCIFSLRGGVCVGKPAEQRGEGQKEPIEPIEPIEHLPSRPQVCETSRLWIRHNPQD